MQRTCLTLIACLLLAACAAQPTVQRPAPVLVDASLPADFSGSWERDFSRGDEIDGVLRQAYYYLVRSNPDRRSAQDPAAVQPSARDVNTLMALARLAELITRPIVLTIAQDAHEIRVERKDDFTMLCAFHGGRNVATETPYGTEACFWNGDDLVSDLYLPDGLQVRHQLTVSDDRQQLRVVTTVSSSSSRVPFTLRRFYTRFDRPAPDFNCVETLSMKRVCSTGDIEL